jgi:hypothetical protein
LWKLERKIGYMPSCFQQELKFFYRGNPQCKKLRKLKISSLSLILAAINVMVKQAITALFFGVKIIKNEKTCIL